MGSETDETVAGGADGHTASSRFLFSVGFLPNCQSAGSRLKGNGWCPDTPEGMRDTSKSMVCL
jgi:hypothetical protein